MKINKIIDCLKNPPTWLIIVSILVTLIFLTTSVLVTIFCPFWFSIIVYILTLLWGSYAVYWGIKLALRLKITVTNILMKNKYTREVVTNHGLQVGLSSAISTIVNIIYCTSLLSSALISGSMWLGCLTLYNIALAVTRSSILVGSFGTLFTFGANVSEYNSHMKSIRTYKICGALLLVTSLAMCGMIVQMIFMEADIKYPTLLLYFTIGFTIIKVFSAICNIFKTIKSKNLVLQSISNINLNVTLISVFNLQIGIIKEFGNGKNFLFLNALTGSIVSILMTFFGVFMVIKGDREFRENEIIFTYTD